MMASKRTRVLNLISLALLTPAFGLAAFRFYAPFRLSVLVALGRSPVCSWNSAVKAPEMIREHMADMDRIRKASRVGEADSDGYRLWDTPKGQFWMPPGNDRTLASLLTEQQHRIYGAGENGVRAGDVVLDCGAHVGVYTRVALAAGAKLVVAIEPSPANLPALRRNLADAIAQGRVVIYEKGVWDQETTMSFHVDPNNSAGSSVAEPNQHGSDLTNVKLTTIDKLVAELNLERVDFIKMDIEGAEQRALVGARQTLARHKPRLAIAGYHLPDDQTKIPGLVAAARTDYKMTCGPCGEMDYRVIPHTLLFR